MAYKYFPPNDVNLEIKPAIVKAIANPITTTAYKPIPNL